MPEAELHRVLSLETNPRNRAILTLLYASGMRVSELCGLCWQDLQPNSDGGQVTVLGKGGVTRAVKIPASVWKLVSGLRGAKAEPGDPVFRSRKKGNGGVLRPLAVLQVVRQAAARAGIELPRLAPLVPPRPRLSCPRPRCADTFGADHPRPRQHHHHRPLPPCPPQRQLQQIPAAVRVSGPYFMSIFNPKEGETIRRWMRSWSGLSA